MTTRLILVSHAPTAATRAARFPDDESLDHHGYARAQAAVGALYRLDEVRSGPERRCQETAAGLSLEPRIDPAVADLDVGSWRGCALSEIEHAEPAALRAWLTDPAAAPHGGESVRDLLDRVGDWLDGWGTTSGRIAVITHSAVIRAAVLHALHVPPESFWRIDVSPLSHTWLSGGGNRWTLRETGHPLTPPGEDA